MEDRMKLNFLSLKTLHVIYFHINPQKEKFHFGHVLLNQFSLISETCEAKAAGLCTWPLLTLHGACLQEPRWDIPSADRWSCVPSLPLCHLCFVLMTGLNVETLTGSSAAPVWASEPRSN